jgi:predicted Rossmann fold flavoprotein
VPQTVQFFRELGVELKQEETGKLFPVSDSARSVLNALLGEIHALGVELKFPWRVGRIERADTGNFIVIRDGSTAETEVAIETSTVILATGGMALPKSGSDGGGYALAESLGHTITDRVFPALVPLVIGHTSRWITDLSGISTRACVEVRSGSGKRLVRFENDLLCTHFGLSGPAVMDASRWFTDARTHDPSASLRIDWMPACPSKPWMKS